MKSEEISEMTSLLTGRMIYGEGRSWWLCLHRNEMWANNKCAQVELLQAEAEPIIWKFDCVH
jgi:hypothetical protein